MNAAELRSEVRDFLAAELDDDVISSSRRSDDEAFEARRRWNRKLADARLAAVEWPARFGGRDADLDSQIAYVEEMARARAPGPVNAIGVANIAPAIMMLGTDEQKQRFLWPMLRGDEIWSQGMSEPDAGSDLASLACRAELQGDHFVVSGQKSWNSNGHRADWCQLYVRTDPDAPKHQGISCLLVDMSTAGIETRPVVSIDGKADFAEVFFDEVRVPATSLLGELDGGWKVATSTLSFERAGVAKLYLMLRADLDDVVDALGAETADPLVRQTVSRRHTEATLLELLARRVLAAAAAGRMPGPEGSVIKLAWAQWEQALAQSAASLFARGGESSRWNDHLLASRSYSIAGGTTEVNKNIVAERVLGLPREPH